MTKFVIIETNGEVRSEESSSYEELKNLVGGWLEGVTVDQEHGTVFAYIDEEGKAKELLPNAVAYGLLLSYGTRLFPGDFVPGRMVLCGIADSEGNDTDAPEGLLEKCQNLSLLYRDDRLCDQEYVPPELKYVVRHRPVNVESGEAIPSWAFPEQF